VVDLDLAAYVRANLPPPPARLLEVGAGGGELALELSAWGYEVTAVDPEPGASHVRGIALADVEGPDGRFDAALAVVSLHHVEPLGPSLERLAALLRPGGRLVVELGIDQEDQVRTLMNATRLQVTTVRPDLAGMPRALVAGLRREACG
jgi:2-polyprenyl-3-methyl-5-hydroxy-6-metoxy-1,4-benzoquinol methylase